MAAQIKGLKKDNTMRIRRNPLQDNETLFDNILRSSQALKDRADSLERRLEQVESGQASRPSSIPASRAPAPSSLDRDFEQYGTSVEALAQSFDFIQESGLSREIGLREDTLLRFILHISLDPIVLRLFKILKDRCVSDQRKLTPDEDELLVQAVIVRNINASTPWILEYPEQGSVWNPKNYDTLAGSKRGGLVQEVLMPRIVQVSQARGLVTTR